nr:transposase (putative), gypsy type [Tanacetum cinerariifolium]GEX75392.1 transposase (putative), gypsy type [Tanacetum cinerariifolium]
MMEKDTIYIVTSVLTQKELDAFCKKYNISTNLGPELPDHNDTIRNSQAGKIVILRFCVAFMEVRLPLVCFVNFIVTPLVMVGCLSRSVVGPPSSDDIVDFGLMGLLNKCRASIRRYHEVFLFVVSLSQSFRDDDVYPTFLDSNNGEMGLLAFIKSFDPFKVKSTARKKKKRVSFNDNLPPVKKVKGYSSIAPLKKNPTTTGKTLVALQKLVTFGAQEDLRSRSATAAMDEFVSSFVTPSLDYEYQDELGSSQDGNLMTCSAFGRFVVISPSSPSTKPVNTD